MSMLTRATLLAITLLSLAAIPASAAPSARTLYDRISTASDPVAAYQALPKAQRQLVRDQVLTPVKATVAPISQSYTRQAAGLLAVTETCWRSGNVVGNKNALGMTIWTYTLVVDWCGNGTRITDQFVRRYGDVKMLFWSYKEVAYSQSITGWSQRLNVFTQAEFKACLFGDLGCMVSKYPWFSFRGYSYTATPYWAMGGY